MAAATERAAVLELPDTFELIPIWSRAEELVSSNLRRIAAVNRLLIGALVPIFLAQ